MSSNFVNLDPNDSCVFFENIFKKSAVNSVWMDNSGHIISVEKWKKLLTLQSCIVITMGKMIVHVHMHGWTHKRRTSLVSCWEKFLFTTLFFRPCWFYITIRIINILLQLFLLVFESYNIQIMAISNHTSVDIVNIQQRKYNI